MHVADHRVVRDFRRFELALRMIDLGVRSRIVQDWTGLSVTRVLKLRRAAADGPQYSEGAKRGPPPTNVSVLFRSRALRDEATAAAIACLSFGVIPEERGRAALRKLPSVARGERLLEAYAAYRVAVPEPSLHVEQLVLIASALTQDTSLRLGECVRCRAPLLVQPDRLRRNTCVVCAEAHQVGPALKATLRRSPECTPERSETGAPQQVSLF